MDVIALVRRRVVVADVAAPDKTCVQDSASVRTADGCDLHDRCRSRVGVGVGSSVTPHNIGAHIDTCVYPGATEKPTAQ